MAEQKEYNVELHICAHCYSMDRLMDHCQRCRTTTYCSKRCQVADWVKHKQSCVPTTETRPDIATACFALYERLPELYAAEQYTAFDNGVAAMLAKGEVMTLPYRFVARSTVCGGWQVGEVHIGDRRTVPSAKAVRVGRWIFALEEDHSTAKGDWLLTVFMGKMHGCIVRVDALPSSLQPAFVLLAWMVDHLSPLLGLDAKDMAPVYVDLDLVVLYEFKPPLTVATADTPGETTVQK